MTRQWDTAIAAADETATLGVADESTCAKGAEVFRNVLVGQTYLPQSENFLRKFKAIDAAAVVPTGAELAMSQAG